MNARIVLRVMAIAVVFMAMPAMAATWYVPDDFANIQAALDGAPANDEVIVRDGTYTGAGNKNLDFKGKALTLRSENGPESTIIDCEGDGRGFIFQWGETSATIVEGFSIINGGNVNEGGGIQILYSWPTITNCIISNNSASYGGGIWLWGAWYTVGNVTVIGNSATDGGGIYITETTNVVIGNSTISGNTATGDGGGIYDDSNFRLRINNSTISGNSATTGYGGGIYNTYSNETLITGSTISGNSSGLGGGGIYIGASSWETDIESSTIRDNTAGWHGGGIFHNGNPSHDYYINNSIISGNTAAQMGGGLYLLSTMRVINSVFTQNSSYSDGGGICVNEDMGTSNLLMTGSTISDNTSILRGGGVSFFFTSEGTITNSVISGNSSETGGGISGFAGNQVTLIHATFSANSATSQGGALYWRGGGVNATNSIFWGDSALGGPEIALDICPPEGGLDISYSDVEGGQAAVYDPYSNLSWGAGNIEEDPLFMGGGNYHLTAGSPCIDTGTDMGIYTDIDGETRPEGGGFDMGADEYGETVSPPDPPSGPVSGTTGTSYTYSTGGASSNYGHSLEYRFDWDDGTYSDWLSSSSASKSWNKGGTYLVKAQARCAIHNSIISSWSGTISVTIAQVLPPSATLISPSPSTTITTNTPTYTWNEVPVAEWYRLWVNDSTGNKIDKWYQATDVCSAGTCSVTPTTVLAAGAGQWWIRTYNSAGYGPWSSGMPFTVSP